MRRVSSVIFAVALLAPSFASALVAGQRFKDVAPHSPSFDATMYLQDQGLVKGYDDGSFRPDQTINRAEFVSIMQRLHLLMLDEEQKKHPNGPIWEDGMCIAVFEDADIGLPFSDVKEDAWYAHAVCHALSQNYVKGYPDGTFRPSQNVTFVEAAKILTVLFAGSQEEAGDWYNVYVRWFGDQHAIPVTIDTLDKPLTRGEMAEMIYRIRKSIHDQPSKTYKDLVKESRNTSASTSTGTSTPASPAPALFDLSTVHVGDKVGGMTVSSVDIRYVADGHTFGIVEFTGTITITSDYEKLPKLDGPSPSDTVCFTNFDPQTLQVLPQVEDPFLAVTYFCLPHDNAAVVRKYFPEQGSGRATFTINRYTIPYIETEAWATAELSDVTSIKSLVNDSDDLTE